VADLVVGAKEPSRFALDVCFLFRASIDPRLAQSAHADHFALVSIALGLARKVELGAKSKNPFQNTARGHMLATTMSGQGTGLGGNYLLIDDPHDTENVVSDKERQRTLHNFDHKLSTRLDDPKLGVIVMIMQRLHTRDLSGHVLQGPDGKRWTHLSIPMEAPASKTYIFPLSKKEYVRKEGELLNPVREGHPELEEHKARLGIMDTRASSNRTPCRRAEEFSNSTTLISGRSSTATVSNNMPSCPSSRQ
jgi:hypothetical protein